MSPEAPKRRLPRFSLITLVVAVNVAGVLVWANAIVRTRKADSFSMSTIDARGWPFTACEDYMDIQIVWSSTQRLDPPMALISRHWDFTHLFANVITFSIAVAAIAVVTEFLVRKFRKAKRHDG